MFLSGITFGIFNSKHLRNSRAFSEYGVELDTFVECSQNLVKTHRKDTKVIFVPSGSISLDISDNDSLEDNEDEIKL